MLVYRYTASVPGDRTVKTAVSLPERLFEATERAARRRGVPRSRIFVEALEQHLSEEEESDITAQINAALEQPMTQEEAEEEAAAEAFAAEAARRLLPHWEWTDDRSG
jgi:metal-responsive CopG/Arc/MetJ family transcriptional regulator